MFALSGIFSNQTYSILCMQSQDINQMKSFHRKAEVNHEIQQLKSKMRDSQVFSLIGYLV
jgi:hypothetical protein